MNPAEAAATDHPAMAPDAYTKDSSMTDPIAGAAAFAGTAVKLVKIAGAEAGSPLVAAGAVLSGGPRMTF